MGSVSVYWSINNSNSPGCMNKMYCTWLTFGRRESDCGSDKSDLRTGEGSMAEQVLPGVRVESEIGK